MGKLFDKINKIGDYDSPIEKYLISKDFYEDEMSPRFLDGIDYDELTTGRHCLRHDSSINDGETLRIFINETDIYYEVQSRYGSYGTSGRYEPCEYPTVEDIDNLLDKICSWVIR